MSLFESIMGQLGGDVTEKLGGLLGADKDSTGKGIAAALPVLMGALARNSKSDEGAQSLASALDKDHDGSILSDLGGFLGNGDSAPGQSILKHVLGGKQSTVQNSLSKASGLSGEGAGKLLSMLAPVVLGALGKAKRETGADSRALAGMLDQERQTMEKNAPQGMGMLGALLDADGDGDVDLSDLAKKGGGLLGKLFGR